MAPEVKHWRDRVNAAIGVWLILAPWALGFEAERTAIANSVVVGLGLPALALAAIITVPYAWERWSELLLDPWLVASPQSPVFNTLAIAVGGVGTNGVGANGAGRRTISCTAKNKRIEFDCSIAFASTAP